MIPNELCAIGMAIVAAKIIHLHFMNKNITKLYKKHRLYVMGNDKNL